MTCARVWLSGKFCVVSQPSLPSGSLVFGLDVERWTPTGEVVERFICEADGETASKLIKYAKPGTRLELSGAWRPSSSQSVRVHEVRPVFASSKVTPVASS